MASDRSVAAEYGHLPAYFLLAYGVSWLFWVPLALSELDIIRIAIPRFFFLLGGIGPLAAATWLTWRSLGRRGLGQLYGRLLAWRVHWGWYVAALLWPAGIAAVAFAVARAAGIPAVPSFAPATAILSSIVLTSAILIVEEVGWRGYALPRLQSRHNALTSAILVGVLWGPWHFPLHWMPDYPAPLENPFASIAVFTFFAVLFSIVLTWIFNSTRGSLLLAVLAHQAFNSTNLRAVSVEPPGPFMMAGFALLALFAGALIAVLGRKDLSRRRRITVAAMHPQLARRGLDVAAPAGAG